MNGLPAILLVALLVGCSQSPTSGTANAPASVAPEAAAPSNPAPAEAAALPAKAVLPATIAITIPVGTPLVVRTDTSLSTKTARAGEAFSATLTEPLTMEGREVAPAGARVRGVVVTSNDGGRVKGRSSIAVRLTSLALANGTEVDLQTSSITRVARATKKKDALKIGVGSGIGAAIGAIAGGGRGAAIGAGAGAAGGTGVVLATKGDPAVIPAETALHFTLREPIQTELAR